MIEKNSSIRVLIAFAFFTATVAEAREAEATPQRMLEIESQVTLPPDPGPNGDALLQGYDVDGDGVRDDIQRYVEFRYWDEPMLKAAYYEFVRTRLTFIASADQERATLVRLSDQEGSVYKCMMALTKRDGSRDFIDELRELESKMLNTAERLSAFYRGQAKLSGIYSGGDIPDAYFKHCKKYGFRE